MNQHEPCPDCGQSHPDEFYAYLGAGVWQDDIGKHLRFAITDLGVGITVDILPVPEDQFNQQADALLALMASLPELVAQTLDSAFAAWEAEENG